MSSPKEMPHDYLAEKSFISSLLIDGNSFDEISDLNILKEDFYDPKFGMVYEAVKELALENKPIDYITVCSKLTDLGFLETVGGNAAVLEISEDQSSSANVNHYGKIVKDKSVMRQIVRKAMEVSDMGLKYTGNTQDFLQEVESSFFKLTQQAKTGGMVTIKQALKQNIKDLEKEGRAEGEISGQSSGLRELDKRLLGMQAGQLLILAARPGMGKTALALNMAVNATKTSKLPVAIFSLEMLAPELSGRLLAAESKVDNKRMRTKNFLDTDLRSIGEAVQTLSSLPIFINDDGGTTILDIMSQCRKIKAEQGLGLIVVDYIQLMSPVDGRIPREQQISEMSRGLKNLAKEMECPVIALSQLNRGVESRTDKRPMVSDLRESGSIEQDADAVLLIYRDEFYNKDSKEQGIAEIIVGKNRAGEVGTAKVSWVGAYTLFSNLANDFEQQPTQ